MFRNGKLFVAGRNYERDGRVVHYSSVNLVACCHLFFSIWFVCLKLAQLSKNGSPHLHTILCCDGFCNRRAY
eukprot:2374595-Amphidinium_carterae.1